jgi:hypothetical protein
MVWESASGGDSRLVPTRMHESRLIHPVLYSYVDVTVHQRDGRHMATVSVAKDSRHSPRGHHPDVYRFGPSANLTRLGTRP